MSEHELHRSGSDEHAPDTAPQDDVVVIEPDRHELAEAPRYDFAVTRRAFIGTVGAGVIVLVVARRGVADLPVGDVVSHRAWRDPIAAWLHVGEDGVVTAYTVKVEVGQDIRTSLTQVVADELSVEPAAVRLVMGD